MPTTPPTISSAPQVPQRGVKATFGPLVDAFNTWKANSVAQFAAVAANVYANAVEVFTNAGTATTAAQTATDAAAAATATAGATLWVSGQSVAQDAAKISPLDRRTYRRKTATGSGTTDPSLDVANYVLISTGAAPLLWVREEYSSGTAATTVAGNTVKTAFARALNTTKTNTASGASVASNQITLSAGRWEVDARAAIEVPSPSHKLTLYCVTDAAIVLDGVNEGTNASARLSGEITIVSGTKIYELRHVVTNGNNNPGKLGTTAGTGSPEVYSEISLKKVA